MRRTTASLVVSTLLVLGASAPGAAQAPVEGSAADFWRWALEDLREGREGGPPVRSAGHEARAAGDAPGPAFCRSGVGHPVHGRAWCLGKGFAPGPVPWVRVRLGGLRLQDSDRPRRFDGRLGAGDLAAILGDAALDRLLERAGADRSKSFLNGRWQEGAGPPGARILQVRVVDRPLAEINDLDGDDRVDAVLVYRPGG